MSDTDGIKTLTDMGFLPNRAAKAWAIMGSRGVQAAMDWLLEHNEDPDIDEPYKAPQGNVLGAPSETAMETSSEAPASTEETPDVAVAPVRPQLTAEEKIEQTRKLQERINKKRLENEELERKRKIEQEKKRRSEGQTLTQIKADMELQEAKKLAAERRREKREDALARQRVKEQIARDRADKKARLEKEKEMRNNPAGTPVAAPAAASTTPSAPTSTASHTHAKLQIRLPNGSRMVETFTATEQLSAVRLYIEMNRTDGVSGEFNLMTTFPRHVFTPEEYDVQLIKLGLTPSCCIVVQSKS